MLTFSVNKSALDCMDKIGRMNLKSSSAYGREWLGTFIVNTVDGLIEDGNMSVEAYGYACDRHIRMEKQRHEVSLLSREECKNNGASGVADIVAFYVDNNLDAVVDMADTRAFVTEFCEMREYIAVEEGVDIWKLINLAKINIAKNGERLRKLAEDYSLKDMLTELLSSPLYQSELECVFN